MKAIWLLEQLLYLSDNFNTHDVVDMLNLRFQGNHSVLAEVTIKKISNKLIRLCCMRFLTRSRAKRIALTRGGAESFKGYKYTYRVTKQGLSYLKYMSRPNWVMAVVVVVVIVMAVVVVVVVVMMIMARQMLPFLPPNA